MRPTPVSASFAALCLLVAGCSSSPAPATKTLDAIPPVSPEEIVRVTVIDGVVTDQEKTYTFTEGASYVVEGACLKGSTVGVQDFINRGYQSTGSMGCTKQWQWLGRFHHYGGTWHAQLKISKMDPGTTAFARMIPESAAVTKEP